MPFIVKGRPIRSAVRQERNDPHWSVADGWKFAPQPTSEELPQNDLRKLRIETLADLYRQASE
jgi:hypothetical protein